MRGVWCSSFRDMPSFSCPSSRSTRTMERWPREEARWREVFERPTAEESGFRRMVGRGEVSGFWRRVGWVFRMRWTRRESAAWMARRRRREGSILMRD